LQYLREEEEIQKDPSKRRENKEKKCNTIIPSFEVSKVFLSSNEMSIQKSVSSAFVSFDTCHSLEYVFVLMDEKG